MRSFRQPHRRRVRDVPRPGGEREIDGENSVAWDRSVWEAVEKRTFTIPYFHGNRRAMPLVKLRNRETGMTAWFANVHNPASTAGHRRLGQVARARRSARGPAGPPAARHRRAGVPDRRHERARAGVLPAHRQARRSRPPAAAATPAARAAPATRATWTGRSAAGPHVQRVRRGPRRREQADQRPPDRGQPGAHRRRHLRPRPPALTHSRPGASGCGRPADPARLVRETRPRPALAGSGVSGRKSRRVRDFGAPESPGRGVAGRQSQPGRRGSRQTRARLALVRRPSTTASGQSASAPATTRSLRPSRSPSSSSIVSQPSSARSPAVAHRPPARVGRPESAGHKASAAKLAVAAGKWPAEGCGNAATRAAATARCRRRQGNRGRQHVIDAHPRSPPATGSRVPVM